MQFSFNRQVREDKKNIADFMSISCHLHAGKEDYKDLSMEQPRK